MEAMRKRRTRLRQGSIVLALAVIVALIVFLTSLGGKSKSSNVNATASTSTSTTAASTTTAAGTPPSAPDQTGGTLTKWACPNPNGSSPHILHFPSTPPPMCINPADTYTATLTTSEGPVTFTLDTKDTPKTANNFAVLSWYHYYDGTSIDRIDTSIDIEQTGSPSTQSIADPGPGYSIPDEPTMKTNSSGQLTGPYSYTTGDVVMARGSAANSGAAQYFFVYGPAASALDSQGTYVVFGHVTAGLNVLQDIAKLYEACPSSDQTCLGGVPSKVVLISKVTITAS